MKKGFLVMAMAVLASCTPGKQEGNRYNDFPETRQLVAETMPLDTALFRYPFRVRVQEDKVAVLDLHGADCFLHVFSYPDMHYLASGGRRGERLPRCCRRRTSVGAITGCGHWMPTR